MTDKGTKRYLKTALCVLGVLVIASAILTGIYWKDIKLSWLIHKVEKGSWNESKWAAEELGKMGEDAAPAIPVLVNNMGGHITTDSSRSIACSLALVNIGEPAKKYLKDYIDGGGPNTLNAVNTLVMMGGDGVTFIIEKIHDNRLEVRKKIVDALFWMHGDILRKAKPDLIEIAMHEEDPGIRRSAIGAIGEIGPDDDVIEALCIALDDEYLRGGAIAALKRFGADAEPALEKLRDIAEKDTSVAGTDAQWAIKAIEKAIEENRVGVTESE